MNIRENLKIHGIELEDASSPAGNYVPYIITGKLVFISGQLPFKQGKIPITGVVGETVSSEDAIEMAKLCALALISQLKSACNGDLDRVSRVVKLGGFVASTSSFTAQPTIINGASDIMVKIFGEHGKHSRFAVGVSSLPLNAPVEIEGIFELK
tara:strand:+ start:305 stop:766 length:462 start_codon:yes stop_codon:yes gene_type:complete